MLWVGARVECLKLLWGQQCQPGGLFQPGLVLLVDLLSNSVGRSSDPPKALCFFQWHHFGESVLTL